jgi:hypothetical protein
MHYAKSAPESLPTACVNTPVLSCCTCALNTLGGFASRPALRKLSASILRLLLLADLSLQASRMPGCVWGGDRGRGRHMAHTWGQ